MIRVSLLNPFNKTSIFSDMTWKVFKRPTGNEELLITEDYVTAFSTFQSVNRSTAGTTSILTPDGDESFVVTDVLVSATKVNSATVSLVFDDGVNSEVLFTASTNNQPIPFGSWGVKGRMQSWRNASLNLVTVNSVVAFVTVVYMRLPDSLIFSEWDNLR